MYAELARVGLQYRNVYDQLVADKLFNDENYRLTRAGRGLFKRNKLDVRLALLLMED